MIHLWLAPALCTRLLHSNLVWCHQTVVTKTTDKTCRFQFIPSRVSNNLSAWPLASFCYRHKSLTEQVLHTQKWWNQNVKSKQQENIFHCWSSQNPNCTLSLLDYSQLISHILWTSGHPLSHLTQQLCHESGLEVELLNILQVWYSRENTRGQKQVWAF